MIRGIHAMFYTSEAEALRAFIRDKLGFPFIDVGEGWLIFDPGEAEIGCHPDAGPTRQDISFYCDDIEATVADLKAMRDGYETTWLKPLERQVNALNDSVGKPAVRIVPVSRAVFALRERVAQGTAPGIAKQSDLFRDDLGHPQPPLAALVTYCHFAAIYGRSPVGLPVPAALKGLPDAGAMNRLLQELAWQAVIAYPLSGVRAEPKAPKARPRSRQKRIPPRRRHRSCRDDKPGRPTPGQSQRTPVHPAGDRRTREEPVNRP